MALLKKLSSAIGRTARYKASVATEQEFSQCLELRKEVFADSLASWKGEKKHCPALSDEYDEKSTHLICKDTRSDKVVGSLRLSPSHLFLNDESLQSVYGLKNFPSSIWPFLSITSRLATTESDKNEIRDTLIHAGYETTLTDSKTSLSILVCPPDHFAYFRNLGYRPLARVTASPFGGYCLPLFLDIHGYESLRLLDSPFYEIAEKHGFPAGTIGQEWYRNFIFQHGSIETGYHLSTSGEFEEFHSPVTEGLSESAKKQLLSRAVNVECNFGDVVISRTSHERFVGMVKKGTLEVHSDGKLLGVLAEGAVFGEIAFILGGTRSAEVKAASEETEVILLNPKAIDSLKGKDDRVQIWKNLAKLVAQRVVSANAAIAEAQSKEDSTESSQ